MILLYCLSFLFLGSDISLTQVEVLFNNPKKTNTLISPQKDTDLEAIRLGNAYSHPFKADLLNYWRSFHQTLYQRDTVQTEQNIAYIKTHYSNSDKSFITNYYQLLFHVVYSSKINTKRVKKFLQNEEKKNRYGLSSYVLYYVIAHYNSRQILDENYYYFFKEILRVQKKHLGKYSSYNIQSFSALFRTNGLQHLEKKLYTSDFVDLKNPYLILQKMATHYFFDELTINKQLYQTYKAELEGKLKPYALAYIDSLNSIGINNNLSKDDQNNLTYITSNRRIRKLIETNGNAEEIAMHIRQIDKTSYMEEVAELQMLYEIYTDATFNSVDTLYKKVKQYESDRHIQILTNIFQNTYLPLSKEIIFYFVYALKHDLEYALNELLYFGYLKHYFQKNILPKLLNENAFRELIEKKNIALSKLNTLEEYVEISELYSLSLHYQKRIKKALNTAIKNRPKIKDIQAKLTPNETLLIVLKGIKEKQVVRVTQTKLTTLPLNQFLNEIDPHSVNNSYIILDNSNGFNTSFSSLFYTKYRRIPQVRYIYTLADMLSFSTDEVSYHTLSFLGVDSAFTHNKTYFSKLYYVLDEYKAAKRMFSTSFHLNTLRKNISLTSDITHYSGHFITSGIHSFFNQVPIGVENKKAVTLSAYELFGKPINSNLVVFNSCESASSNFSGQLDGHTQFGKSFIENGAKSVLVTTRKVDDKTSSIFLEMFYSFLKTEIDAVTALKSTYKWALDTQLLSENQLDLYQLYGNNNRLKKSYFYLY